MTDKFSSSMSSKFPFDKIRISYFYHSNIVEWNIQYIQFHRSTEDLKGTHIFLYSCCKPDFQSILCQLLLHIDDCQCWNLFQLDMVRKPLCPNKTLNLIHMKCICPWRRMAYPKGTEQHHCSVRIGTGWFRIVVVNFCHKPSSFLYSNLK